MTVVLYDLVFFAINYAYVFYILFCIYEITYLLVTF